MTLEYPFRMPMEALCTPAICSTARNISREGMQALRPALCVFRRGREEAGLPTRRSWLDRGLSTNGHEERWAAVRDALQFAARVQRASRIGANQLRDDWHLRYV